MQLSIAAAEIVAYNGWPLLDVSRKSVLQDPVARVRVGVLRPSAAAEASLRRILDVNRTQRPGQLAQIASTNCPTDCSGR